VLPALVPLIGKEDGLDGMIDLFSGMGGVPGTVVNVERERERETPLRVRYALRVIWRISQGGVRVYQTGWPSSLCTAAP
jgi:hypothetical protein